MGAFPRSNQTTMNSTITRRAFVAAAAASAFLPRFALAQDADPILTLISTGVLEASPPPGSYDIQMESLYGNSEFLMRPTATGPEPWLAESVEQIEPTRWRITLRPDLTFQNGSPLDAEALLAALQFYAGDENLGDPGLVLLGKPTTMEASGPLSVDIVTPEPFSRVDYGLAHYSYPIFDAAAVASVGGDWSKLVSMGIFTGPYQWSAIEPGKVTYTRYDDYWGGQPALQQVVVRQVADAQAGLQALAAGEGDVFPYVPLTLAPVAAATPGVELIVGQAGVSFVGLALQPDIAPFDDVNVRRALSLAIDNAAIAASIGQGLATPMTGWYLSGDPLEVDWVEYDPAQAEALLDEAGWTREADGPRTQEGQPLEARFYSYTPIGEAIATAAADMAARVGFAATIRTFESYADIQPVQSVDGGIYVVNTESYGLNGDPVGTMLNVVSPSYTTPGYADWLAIIEPALTTSDPDEVIAILKAGQQLNAEQVYWHPVLDFGVPYLVTEAYSNLVPNPFYLLVDGQTAPSA